MTRKLIITADDYGLCGSINQAIEECLRAGAVRATCVMANMPHYDSASSLRRNFPESSIGIHWNITQGRPVLPNSQVSSLVNSDGAFWRQTEFRRRWLKGRISSLEIEAELKAQFELFHRAAEAPDFWNTHQNIHVFPGLFSIFVSISQKLGIRAMRCHNRITVPLGISATLYNLRHPWFWTKGEIISYLSRQAEKKGQSMPEGRIYAPGYTGLGTFVLEDMLNKIPWHKFHNPLELVIHPATHVEPEFFGSLTQSRITEYQVFRDLDLVELLRRQRIEAHTFDSLGVTDES